MLRTALGPAVARFLEDPAIVEVMLNPDGRLWVDRLSDGLSDTGERLSAADGERIVRLVAHHVGAEVHDRRPRVSAELPETGGTLPAASVPMREVLLDERGRQLSSEDFAALLGRWRDEGVREARFRIGAADGHGDAARGSADLLLGVGFNWVNCCALQLMIAQQAGLKLGDFVWFGGDVHLYLNHLDQAREQLAREPRPFPKMRLTRHAASIDDYRIEDFEVEDYSPHAVIKADVAV